MTLIAILEGRLDCHMLHGGESGVIMSKFLTGFGRHKTGVLGTTIPQKDEYCRDWKALQVLNIFISFGVNICTENQAPTRDTPAPSL